MNRVKLQLVGFLSTPSVLSLLVEQFGWSQGPGVGFTVGSVWFSVDYEGPRLVYTKAEVG